MTYSLELQNELATVDFGNKIGKCLLGYSKTFIIYLIGDLGAGKTTLVRGILRGLNYFDKVKSPTFSIIEPYLNTKPNLLHFDLYRINSPEELEFIGIRDYLIKPAILCFEWPDLGKGSIPEPDLVIEIKLLEDSRALNVISKSAAATIIAKKLKDA